MTETKREYLREKSFEFYYDWHRFVIGIGYDYSAGYDDKPNLIYIDIAFFQIGFAW